MIRFNAVPLEKYSSLHRVSLLNILGIKTNRSPSLKVGFNFSLQPISQQLNSQLLITLRDAHTLPAPGTSDFCINNFVRWRLNIAQYDSFEEFTQKQLSRRLDKKRTQIEKVFVNYGATISILDGDWSEHVHDVYHLYLKVAQKNGTQLYDLNFFRSIAKRKEYKLMCLWYEGALFGALVMIDEEPVFHSMLCCLDYNHSKKTRAYSQMHYEIIRLAIESKKYTIVDIGMTADKAKATIGYQPVESCMDISAKNFLIKSILRFASRLFSATINQEAKLELSFRFRKNNLRRSSL